MDGKELLLVLVIGIGLAASAGVVTAATGTLFDNHVWDVILDYQYNADETGIESYDVTGDYDSAIDCDGSWEEVSSGSQSTLEDTLRIRYGIDYALGHLGIEHLDDGTVDSTIWGCSGSFLITRIHTSHWEQWSESTGDTNSLDETDASGEVIAPVGPLPWRKADVEADDSGAKWTLRIGGRVGSTIPFTGELYGGFINDDNPDPVTVFDEGTSCTAIGGDCWPGGGGQEGGITVVNGWDDPDVNAGDWSITYTGRGPFGLNAAVPAGSYSDVFETYDS